MVINNFNVISVFIMPNETDAPLAVYPNAVLPLAVPFQGFESVGRWNQEILKAGSGIEQL